MGRSREREGSLSSTGSGRAARSKKWVEFIFIILIK
jgi:hypothetical protein